MLALQKMPILPKVAMLYYMLVLIHDPSTIILHFVVTITGMCQTATSESMGNSMCEYKDNDTSCYLFQIG